MFGKTILAVASVAILQALPAQNAFAEIVAENPIPSDIQVIVFVDTVRNNVCYMQVRAGGIATNPGGISCLPLPKK